jgi:hypothetical protein
VRNTPLPLSAAESLAHAVASNETDSLQRPAQRAMQSSEAAPQTN